MSDSLLNIEAAQERLGGIGRTTLFAFIRAGDIGVVKVGRRTFIPASEIADFLERNKRWGSAPTPQPMRQVYCRRCGHKHICTPRETQP